MPNCHRIALLTPLFLSLGLLTPPLSDATFYKYRDSRGTVCITNECNKVPRQYRSRVKIIREDAPAPPPTAARQDAPGAVEQDAPPDTQPVAKQEGWLARQWPLLKILGLIGGLCWLALVVGRFVSALLPTMLGKVVRIAFFLGIGVFIFKSYSERVVNAFTRLTSETATVQKAVDKSVERMQYEVDP
jgi:hypothetical protein